MNYEKIGKFIFQLRTEKKLSQNKLAEMIPISRQAISKWERGLTIPDSSTLVRLSDIFNVTINELLEGERIQDNTIERLQSKTLEIVDENKKNKTKYKQVTKGLLSIIFILLFSLLGYYFINSYNSIKTYTLSGNNKAFTIYDGLLITTKSKIYLKIGEISYDDSITIETMKLYYKKNKKEYWIAEDKDLNKYTITDLNGYAEKLPQQDLKYIIKNLYLEIHYNKNKKETIKINSIRDFINDEVFFYSHKKYKKKVDESTTSSKRSRQLINKIKEKGTKIENAYLYEVNDEDNTILITYLDNCNCITIRINEVLYGSYYIGRDFICMNSKDKPIDNCQEWIENILDKYLLEDVGN